MMTQPPAGGKALGGTASERSDAAVSMGLHRVLEPPGVLPYQATRLDVTLDLARDEVLVEVEALNIDSASWTQLRGQCEGDADRMADQVRTLVETQGKMHNPVTGSGGMLIGTVAGLGSDRQEPAVGTRVCSLVSLTCTPLVLHEITHLDPASPHVGVRAQAVLSGVAAWAAVPDDLPSDAFLSAMDVVGAPAWAARLVRPGMRVAVIGAGGKAGLLTTAAARQALGDTGSLAGLCWPPATTAAAQQAGADTTSAVDCTDPIATMDAVRAAFDGGLADLVFGCANVPGCEGGAVLSCSDDGEVLLFSMATSLPAAALITEAMGKTCRLTIGTGYLPEGPEVVTDLLRRRPELVALLESQGA